VTLSTSTGRSGSGLTGREAPPSTVITRLRAKQTRPGRSVIRRLTKRASHAKRQHQAGGKFKDWLLKGGTPVTATRINPGRDHRSRKSGRLRKELR
jgi:hypothetical protein